MFENYFKGLYQRTMTEAYALAHKEIIQSLREGGSCLDCGASTGGDFRILEEKMGLRAKQYTGIEWNAEQVNTAQEKGLNILKGDLNETMPFDASSFDTVFGLSVVEHLLNPCKYIKECHRTLKKGGTLILLTPNISTYFTAALILMGKMPSSGPHPDSEALLKSEELFKVSTDQLHSDAESDTPVHRHLVVFSYKVLRSYLKLAGFTDIRGFGFGLYPFPNITQPLLEKIDPYHCHQMVFVAKKAESS